MKKLLENVILLLITAILVLGIYNYVKSIEESKEEDPIVDVLPDDEQPGEDEPTFENALTLTISGTPVNKDDLTIYYEKGMTWEDWVNSKYNIIGASLEDLDGEYYIFLGNGFGCVSLNNSTGAPEVRSTDVIDSSNVYSQC